MKRHAAVVAVAAAALATAVVSAQQPRFTSHATAVVVEVGVFKDGRPVTDLGPQQFELRDNGVLQRLETASIERVPLDLTVLVDQSYSIAAWVPTALKQVVPEIALRKDVRLELLGFDAGVRQITVDDLSMPRAGRTTALLDAVTGALLRAPTPGQRPILIVVTDGFDMVTIIPEPIRAAAVRRSDWSVHLIVVEGNRRKSPFEHRDPAAFDYGKALRTLATESAGWAIGAYDDNELRKAIDRIVVDASGRYVLRYIPTGVESGGWHDLSVRVKKEGTFTIRARRGYWGTPAKLP